MENLLYILTKIEKKQKSKNKILELKTGPIFEINKKIPRCSIKNSNKKLVYQTPKHSQGAQYHSIPLCYGTVINT